MPFAGELALELAVNLSATIVESIYRAAFQSGKLFRNYTSIE